MPAFAAPPNLPKWGGVHFWYMKVNRTIDAEFFYGATPEIFRRADELRKNMTKAEKLLWEELSGKKINGLRFRRQHPISKFIVDFYCHAKRLIIEIDGNIHNISDAKEHDEGREYELKRPGLNIVRFTNEDIFNNLDDVISKVRDLCIVGG